MTDDYLRIPIDRAIVPPTHSCFCDVVTDKWWLVENDCLLIYKEFSLQCNSNESISRRLANGKEVRFLPIVYLPCSVCHDGDLRYKMPRIQEADHE